MSKALDSLFESLPARLTVDQLTGVLGLSDRSVAYRWLREGRIPAIKLGGTWMILRDDVRDFLEANYNVPPPRTPGHTPKGPPGNPQGDS